MNLTSPGLPVSLLLSLITSMDVNLETQASSLLPSLIRRFVRDSSLNTENNPITPGLCNKKGLLDQHKNRPYCTFLNVFPNYYSSFDSKNEVFSQSYTSKNMPIPNFNAHRFSWTL